MQKPIGIFDSGYGGLTVLQSIVKQLPQYDYLYIGDNARAPYGSRSFETVYEYTLEAVKYFFDAGCELVILACNTASAKALRNIQQNYLPTLKGNKRVLGVIRPSAEFIGNSTSSKQIGIFATSGTVKSESYILEIEKLFPQVKVFQEACPIWVPLIENNLFNTDGGKYFIEHHVNNLISKSNDIDTIILGCTHYPILQDLIKEYVNDNVKILSQGQIVADALVDYLNRHPEIETNCSKGGNTSYLTTDDPIIFAKRAEIFLQKEIVATKINLH